MKKFYTALNGLLTVLSLLLTATSFAQINFLDQASNYKNGWLNGTNEGTGFRPWVIRDGSVSCTNWPDVPLIPGKNVRLFVTAPSNTPDTASLYVSGNFEEELCGTSDWTGGGGSCLKMNKVQGSRTCFWIDLSLDTSSQFKITRGNWNTRLKNSNNDDVSNVRWNGNDNMYLTVAKWNDLLYIPPTLLNAGYFIGNPKNDGIGTDGIDTTAFGMWSIGETYVKVYRKFAAPMNVGDFFTFYWGMNWDANAGNKGFDFKSGDSVVLNVNNGGSAAITVKNDTALKLYGTNPMLVFLSRTSETQYSIELSGRDSLGSETFSKSYEIKLPIDGIEFYNGNQKNGDGRRNIYFNNLQLIVAEQTSVKERQVEKGFSVYPNPVAKGGNIQLAFRNRKAGQYTISLFDINGKRVQQSVVGHAGGNAIQRVAVSSQLKSGMYIAEVIGNGSREHVKLLVQ